MDDLVFDGIFLFFVVVGAGAWVLVVGLLGEGRLSFVLPEVADFGLGAETGGFLADVGSLRVCSLVLVACLFDCLSDLVLTWARVVWLESIVVMVHLRTRVSCVWHL